MEFEKIKNKGQAKLFENRFLEMMTKTHPLVIYSIYFPMIAWMLWSGNAHHNISAGKEALVFAGGVAFWTLFEYLMHRYLFHMVSGTERGRRIIYTMHGVHHEYPRDRSRLFMPPVPSLLISGAIFALMFVFIRWYALSFFPGFMFGYMLYASMHYAIHAFAPPRFMKALWRNHHLHHYKTPDMGFGVSSVIWDVVFGTVPSKDGEHPKGATEAHP